jgi:hypothetical protein
MKLTNKLRLPEAIVRAVQNDSYTKGEADISVTELLVPPQMRRLKLEHDDELEEDVSDRIYSLQGQSMHHIIERAADGDAFVMVEATLYAEYLGWKVKGQVDHLLLGTGELLDFKLTSVTKIKAGQVPREWEQQTNIYRRMLEREKGMVIPAMSVIAILRDWSKGRSHQTQDYPQAPVLNMPIPLWTPEQADAFIEERIRLHQAAEPQSCSDHDVWARPAKWAVMKRGAVKAVRLFDNPVEAEQLASTSAGLYVEHRPGEAVRCQDWCQVAHLCPQWQTDPRNNRIPSVEETLFSA